MMTMFRMTATSQLAESYKLPHLQSRNFSGFSPALRRQLHVSLPNLCQNGSSHGNERKRTHTTKYKRGRPHLAFRGRNHRAERNPRRRPAKIRAQTLNLSGSGASRGSFPFPCVCYNSWRAPVAQLDRASDFESGGRGFESLRARSDQRLLFVSATLRASNAMYEIKTMRSSSRKP